MVGSESGASSAWGQRPALPGEVVVLDDERVGRLRLYVAEGPPSSPHPPLVLVHSVNAAASAYEVRPIFEHFARSRPTVAFDLPGFGGSDRSAREYSPRLMTDAVLATVDHVRSRHQGLPVDALAVSLGCEFLARGAIEEPHAFRSLGLVSPTSLGAKARNGEPGSVLGSNSVYRVLAFPLLSRPLFWLLIRPRVIRYFLERTFGRKEIDEGLWDYAVHTTRAPGAERAPLYFLSALLFSGDATRLYEGLEHPVWISHGVRGDFTDYGGVDRLLGREGVSRQVFPTGALPYFEVPEEFLSGYTEFLEAPADG